MSFPPLSLIAPLRAPPLEEDVCFVLLVMEWFPGRIRPLVLSRPWSRTASLRDARPLGAAVELLEFAFESTISCATSFYNFNDEFEGSVVLFCLLARRCSC